VERGTLHAGVHANDYAISVLVEHPVPGREQRAAG
jgi:hypothetical protein